MASLCHKNLNKFTSGTSYITNQITIPVGVRAPSQYQKRSISVRSRKVARFVFRNVRSLWNLTCTSAAVLPMCLSNFKVIRQFKVPISWLRDFTRSYEKTSFRILRRGPGVTRYKWCDTVDWCLRIRHCYEQLLYTDYWEPFSFTNTFVWLRARGSTNNELREDPVDFLEALYQVMSWCNCAPNHYMIPCWHKVATSYGIIRHKWVKQGCDWYVAYNQLTHLPLVPHICINELDQQWFR